MVNAPPRAAANIQVDFLKREPNVRNVITSCICGLVHTLIFFFATGYIVNTFE
jgi:hypothetical protein